MLKGYDDFGWGIKIVHYPLKQLLMSKNERRILNDSLKRYNWGKGSRSCGAIRYPYTGTSLNGWNPFKSEQLETDTSYYKPRVPRGFGKTIPSDYYGARPLKP